MSAREKDKYKFIYKMSRDGLGHIKKRFKMSDDILWQHPMKI